VTDKRDETPSVALDRTDPTSRPGVIQWCERRFVWLAVAILALAAFNLTFRLGQEFLTEWDESLYAVTAAEVLDHGHWIGTTFGGALDYYNTKPPLNVWLIALAFKAFGKSLIALRLASVASAWLTVALLMQWMRRSLGSAVALLSGLVLATSFGFIHIHAGRSANTDALFTLVMLLTAVTLWADQTRTWARAWLGPLLAMAFLLRGMAVLMPLLLVAAVWLLARPRRLRPWMPTLVGVALFAVPVGAWVAARFQIDQWEFFTRLFFYDFVARSTDVIEGHPGGVLYYLNILQKHHFDWLFAGAAALVLAPIPWARVRRGLVTWRGNPMAVLLVAWAGAALIPPTLMQTKLPWYLNTFYPVFAVAIALLVVHAAEHLGRIPPAWRQRVLAGAVVLAFGVAESKLLWYSFVYRDLGLTDQGIVLAAANQLAGHRLYRNLDDRAGTFVASQLAGADANYAASAEVFLRESRPGDYLIVTAAVSNTSLELVESNGRFWLYRNCSLPGQRTVSFPGLPLAVARQ
jgi:4-amino-4-deoxy-L-arabinose transferase-like glycosyltransferase